MVVGICADREIVIFHALTRYTYTEYYPKYLLFHKNIHLPVFGTSEPYLTSKFSKDSGRKNKINQISI